MSYLDFIANNRQAINGYVQSSFSWRVNYEDSFLKMVSDANPDFKVTIDNLPETLDRATVVNCFHSDHLYEGFVACMLWGGINAKRCAKGHPGDLKTTDAYKAFTYPKDDYDQGGTSQKGVISRLRSVKTLLEKGETELAFKHMADTQKSHIPGVGVSFFTKLLFFLAPDTANPRPLIFDKWSTYIHCALLIDNPDKRVTDFYKGVNKEGLLMKAKHDCELYDDYIKMMKDTATKNKIADASCLEAYLFGFALNRKGHEEDKQRRRFLKRYVLNYFKTKGNGDRLQNKDSVPGRKKDTIIEQHRLIPDGVTVYAYAGKDHFKVFTEVLSPGGEYPKEDDLVGMGMVKKGGNKPYYIKAFKKNQEAEALGFLTRIINLFS